MGSYPSLRSIKFGRRIFWGSVNPLEGRRALDLMERQVGEFGAKAFKFYNVRYDYGSPFPWRMDDPQIAFPVFEKAQDFRTAREMINDLKEELAFGLRRDFEDRKLRIPRDDKLHADSRITLSMLPLGDGVTLAMKR